MDQAQLVSFISEMTSPEVGFSPQINKPLTAMSQRPTGKPDKTILSQQPPGNLWCQKLIVAHRNIPLQEIETSFLQDEVRTLL